MSFELILNKVKEKSQIKDLNNEFLIKKIEKIIKSNREIYDKINFENYDKDKNLKKLIKLIREEIGIVYGSFLTANFKKKERIIEKNNDFELLKIHKSTRERVDYYNEIYSKIFNWYNPKKIVDLCCGINPISLKKYKYEIYAIDLNPSDMEFLNSYFRKNKIKGLAKAYDVTELEFLKDKEFINSDLVFLFKSLDSLEFEKRNISKELISKLPQKKIVVSFPKKSLVSKKDFDLKKRSWFIKFLEKEKLEYKTFEIENEIFYLISKA